MNTNLFLDPDCSPFVNIRAHPWLKSFAPKISATSLEPNGNVAKIRNDAGFVALVLLFELNYTPGP
jgi:hypothetical protein